jgi:hypothetical protein
MHLHPLFFPYISGELQDAFFSTRQDAKKLTALFFSRHENVQKSFPVMKTRLRDSPRHGGTESFLDLIIALPRGASHRGRQPFIIPVGYRRNNPAIVSDFRELH